ncbi:MAG TPA: hypothetical protein VN754_09470 [Candidatus Binataceae bacterium]|nr:hypothetical protein [Candidatus Binataceae bacterium]
MDHGNPALGFQVINHFRIGGQPMRARRDHQSDRATARSAYFYLTGATIMKSIN